MLALCTWLRKESHPECQNNIKTSDPRASRFIPFSVLCSMGVSHDTIKMPSSIRKLGIRFLSQMSVEQELQSYCRAYTSMGHQFRGGKTACSVAHG